MIPALENESYEVIKKLGSGGTADVYLVLDKKSNQKAALKVLSEAKAQENIDLAKLIARESDLIGSLNYPGLVRILETSEKFILLEYCRGLTLEQVGKIDDINIALKVFSSVAITLEYLRANSIIHGDIKPGNIFSPNVDLKNNSDGLFYTKFADFSLGRFESEPESSRAGAGTVGFMAPELINNHKATYETDIFAAGIVFYYLLTGHQPFIENESDPVIINGKVCESEPNPIEHYRDDVPSLVIGLIKSMMAKNPSDRPKSGWEICEILEECGSGYPYGKAIHPKHLISKNADYETACDESLRIGDSDKTFLDRCCNDDIASLKTVLSFNRSKDNLLYIDGRFSFKNRIVVPKVLLRRLLEQYQALPYADKKAVLEASVTKDPIKLSERNITISLYLLDIMEHLLTANTIKTVSKKYVDYYQTLNDHYRASILFLKAGEFEKALTTTHKAVSALKTENQPLRALKLLRKIIWYAELIDRMRECNQLLKLKGDIYKSLGESDKALETYNTIIESYARGDSDKLLADSYKDLGDIYKTKQNFKLGIDSLDNALVIYEALDDKLEVSHTYNNMGNIYRIDNKPDTAIGFYSKALKIQKEMYATNDIASTLNNLGIVYGIKGNLSRSIKLFDISLKLNKQVGNNLEIARTLNNLGFANYLKGELVSAVKNLTESLEYNRQISSKKEILFNLENLTSIMVTSCKINSSIKYLKEGIQLSEELKDLPHSGIFNLNLAHVLHRMGRIDDALQSLTKVKSVLNEIDDAALAALYEIEKARLYYYSGDYENAAGIAKTSLEKAGKTNDKNLLLNSYTVLTMVDFSDNNFEKGIELSQQLNLKRERIILMAHKIRHTLGKGISENLKDMIEETYSFVETQKADIEIPNLLNTLSNYYLSVNEHEKVESLLVESDRIATVNKLVFDKIDSNLLLGDLHFRNKDYEKSFGCYKTALSDAKQVNENISDSELNRTFRNSKNIKYLVSRIQNLKASTTA